MRVNVDSAAFRDPRMKLLARALAISEAETIGRCLMVWLVCYERRSAVMQAIEVDVSADRDGFADAMIRSGLADQDDEGVYVRGVTDRIEFLERQSERGKLSGESRRKRSKPQTAGTNVQRTLNLSGTNVEPPLNEGSRSRSTPLGSTYSLTQAPDPALTQDQSLDHSPTSPGSVRDANAIQPGPNEQNNSVEAHGLPQDAAEPATAGATPPEKGKRKAREPKPPRELPDQAYSLAHLLAGSIMDNHPTGRFARLPPHVREEWTNKWAEPIDKLQRIDGFSWGEIEGMIVWCQRDSFWKNQIHGGDNLRDKWDKLHAARSYGRTSSSAPPPQQSVFDVLDEYGKEKDAKEAKEPKPDDE